MREFTARFFKSDGWWIGWVEEVGGAYAQERTIEEARESLEEALVDILALRRERAITQQHSGEICEPIRIGA